jgi:hypothetical protein
VGEVEVDPGVRGQGDRVEDHQPHPHPDGLLGDLSDSFVVLDACFRDDGKPYQRKNSKWTDANVPAAELDWLKHDLKGTDKRVVVFAHQRLDVANSYGVKNAAEVRADGTVVVTGFRKQKGYEWAAKV